MVNSNNVICKLQYTTSNTVPGGSAGPWWPCTGRMWTREPEPSIYQDRCTAYYSTQLTALYLEVVRVLGGLVQEVGGLEKLWTQEVLTPVNLENMIYYIYIFLLQL